MQHIGRRFSGSAPKDRLIKRLGIGVWTYFSRIGKDYITTIKDTTKQIRDNPVQFVAILSATAAATAVYATCPHEREYHAALTSAAVDLYDTPRCLQNPRSLAHIEERTKLLSRGQLRHANFFGLVHVVWRDDRSEGCRLYSEICPYNYPSSGPANCSKNGPILSFFRLFLYDTPPGKNVDEVSFSERAACVLKTRILDVGALGRFWYLKAAMLDYDINDEEFSETGHAL
ncbi:hypothetical protein Aperf_G00000084532 [Anoplocephala perfoliata]